MRRPLFLVLSLLIATILFAGGAAVQHQIDMPLARATQQATSVAVEPTLAATATYTMAGCVAQVSELYAQSGLDMQALPIPQFADWNKVDLSVKDADYVLQPDILIKAISLDEFSLQVWAMYHSKSGREDRSFVGWVSRRTLVPKNGDVSLCEELGISWSSNLSWTHKDSGDSNCPMVVGKQHATTVLFSDDDSHTNTDFEVHFNFQYPLISVKTTKDGVKWDEIFPNHFVEASQLWDGYACS